MIGTIQTFTDLQAWQKGQELVVEIYKITKKFPQDEIIGLTNQIRRAAISITSNIAEGFGRESYADKLHFYVMARGSVNEVQSQLYAASSIGYLENNLFKTVMDIAVNSQRLIHGLIKATKERL